MFSADSLFYQYQVVTFTSRVEFVKLHRNHTTAESVGHSELFRKFHSAQKLYEYVTIDLAGWEGRIALLKKSSRAEQQALHVHIRKHVSRCMVIVNSRKRQSIAELPELN